MVLTIRAKQGMIQQKYIVVSVPPPSDNFLGTPKSKGGAKIRTCQCEILYKIRKVQLLNKFKDSSNSGISIAIQLNHSLWE